MANLVDYSYSSDSGDSDYSGKPQCLDFSYAGLNNTTLTHNLEAIACQDGNSSMKTADYYESLILKHNRLTTLPDSAAFFINLKVRLIQIVLLIDSLKIELLTFSRLLN